MCDSRRGMTSESQDCRCALWRPAVVCLAALWLMAGALMKMFLGSPNGLPEVIKALPGATTTWFPILIGIELAVAWLVLLRMRLGWPLLVGTLLVFVAILSYQLTQGASSCGCFGDSFTIHPAVMLGIDATLLVLVLAARPWSATPPMKTGAIVTALALLISLTAPWLIEKTDNTIIEDLGVRRPAVELDVSTWPGKMVFDTDLAGHIDVGVFPPDARCVLYRMQCSVCAEHLAELASSDSMRSPEEQMMEPIVLIRLVDKSDSPENAEVKIKPVGPHVMDVTMPEEIDFVVTTPHEFLLREWVVRPAQSE